MKPFPTLLTLFGLIILAADVSPYREHFESLNKVWVLDFPNQPNQEGARILRDWLEKYIPKYLEGYSLDSDIDPWERQKRIEHVVDLISSDDNLRHLPVIENQLYETERQLHGCLVRLLSGIKEARLAMAFANYKALESVYFLFCRRHKITGFYRPPAVGSLD